MVSGLLASVTQLPFLVAACVLGGFALWGWRRTGATGALLVAIAAGVQLVHQLVGIWSMTRLYVGGPSAMSLAYYGMVRSAGALIADVLLIVGFALIVRRLPARR